MNRALFPCLVVLASLVSSFLLPPLRAQEVKIEKVTFALGADENGKPISPKSIFRPTEKIVLIATLNSRPSSGILECKFSLEDQEISRASVDMKTLKDRELPLGTNAFGEFTLKPIEPLPVSEKYQAQVFFEKKSLGVFRFSVEDSSVEPEKTTTSEGRPAVAVQPELAKPSIPQEKGTKEIVDVLLHGTAYVEGVDENDRVWTGTAWLLDKDQRLLITNDHVANISAHDSRFGNVKTMDLYFPEFLNGRVIHDKNHYKKNVEPIRVRVLYGDNKRDLALLQADSLPSNVVPLNLANRGVDLGDSLFSLGGIPRGSEGFWIYTSGEVRAVYQRSLANGYQAETVEADMQTNQGNSGGPVVNRNGELVAVVEGHMTEARSVSLYVDLTEVRAFLVDANPLVSPKSTELLVKRAEHHFESGRFDQALEDFTQVLRQSPNHAYAMSSRGWIFYERGDFETAKAEFDEAIKADRTMLYAYRGRAMVELDNGEYEQAIEDLTHAIRNSTDKEELAEFYNERGVARSGAEDYDKALRDFDRAIAANAQYAWGHANRGNMLIELERYTEAIASLETAVKLDSTEAEFFDMMGRALHLIDNHAGALKLYAIAIEIDPFDADYLVHQAKCLVAFDKYEEAATSLKAAIALDTRNDHIYNEVGIVAFEIGNYSLAYAQFKEATDLNPKDSMYWFNRGHSASKMGDSQTVIADLSRSLKLKEDPDAYAIRGNAYSLTDQSSSARSDFENAHRLAPDAFTNYSTKYLKIANRTAEVLNVFVRYYTRGTDDEFRWYPTSGNDLRYEFAPDEVSGIREDELLIHGSKFHIWAQGVTSGKEYPLYKKSELNLVGEAGYLTDQDEPESETFSITE